MSEFSNYLEGHIAAWLKGTNMPAAPAAVYAGLNDGDPGEAGSGGTEVSGTISARQAITFGAVTSGAMSNSAIIDYGASGGACSASHIKINDALTAGNVLLYSALDATKSISAADEVAIDTGVLAVALTGSLSDYVKNWICNWIKGSAAPSAPAALYMSLWNGDPSGAGSDVTATIRAAGRVAITFGAVTDGVFSNSAEIDFGLADAGATVTHFRIYDAASGGNAIGEAALDNSKTILANDPVKFPVSGITITIQ